jgi:sugar lactone lactonase YvrE
LRAAGGLILATRDGFAFWNEQQRALQYIVDPEADKPHNRFNDGAIDSRGRFWAGTMNTSGARQPEGSLYRLDPDGSLHTMETGIYISNGIGWSPDDTIMYYTDTPRDTIYAYDYDAASGAISNRRIFVQTAADQPGHPDGLTVDSEGYVWSAFWEGARIVRYTGSGQVDQVIQLPALRPTSCAFGGPNLDELYITSSGEAIPTDQQALYPFNGDLFRLKTDVKGLPMYRFGG